MNNGVSIAHLDDGTSRARYSMQIGLSDNIFLKDFTSLGTYNS